MTRRLLVLDTDGTSDRALRRLMVRLIEECAPALVFDLEWVDPTRTRAKTRQVADRLERTLKLFPRADAVFLHRDAEHESPSARTHEVMDGADELRRRFGRPVLTPTVPVVPVRMHEAWLLVSERAQPQTFPRPATRLARFRIHRRSCTATSVVGLSRPRGTNAPPRCPLRRPVNSGRLAQGSP